ncbi:MAG: hypothetical protein ACI9U2_003352 [Bradymonadia bacterium]|jgi:hypothetical protein
MKPLSALLIAALAASVGCRADSGPDDYISQERFAFDAAPPPIDASILDGEERLSIGAFYEGPATETVIIDGLQTHFYIYEATVNVGPTEDERIEGAVSDRFSHAGGPWWGAGVHWDVPRDISGWESLHISLKTSDASMGDLKLGMNDPNEVQAVVDTADYGFLADGEWHDLTIPLSDYVAAGADLTQIGASLVFVGAVGEAGDTMFVDAVFLSRQQ